MRFPMPAFPCEFELPDDWWTESGMVGFEPAGRVAYRAIAGGELVPLREIEPPYRNLTSPKDWHGFSRERMMKILSGIASGAEIDALVQLARLPVDDPAWFLPPYGYRVLDGYHRFFAAVAAGFEYVPARIIVTAGQAQDEAQA